MVLQADGAQKMIPFSPAPFLPYGARNDTRRQWAKRVILNIVGATPRGCPMLDPWHPQAIRIRIGLQPVLIFHPPACRGTKGG